MNRIVICGSGKLREEIFLAGQLLSDAGLQVMVPPLHRIEELVADRPAGCRELAWKGATFAHFNRIDKSDIVFIVNPNGYIGPSTTLELGYAVARHAYIVAMMPDEAEVARTVLLDRVLDTTDVEQACEVDRHDQGHGRNLTLDRRGTLPYERAFRLGEGDEVPA